MLKRRIIGVIVIYEGLAVQSLGFQRYLPIGKPEVVAEYLNKWGIDEVIALDISATRCNSGPNTGLVERIARQIQVPLAYGGGITKRDQMYAVLQSGADKVCLNQALWKQPELIAIGGEYFGNQAIVAAVDVQQTESGAYASWNYLTHNRQTSLLDHLKVVEKYNPGEFFINAVHCDGAKQGFDLQLLALISTELKRPVILCGGAGQPEHFLEAFRNSSISALAAGNFFNYSEHSVNILKAMLGKAGIEIRQDSYANYNDFSFLENGRIARLSEEQLASKKFEIVEKEKL